MRWKSLYSFCRGLPVIHCFRFYVHLWQNCNLNAWQTYGCQWFVLARHHFLDYTRNWYRKQKQENEMDRCVLLGPNFPYFQCMRFYEIYLNEALSFQHCLHSRCFRWDENCFIALDVDFGLFIVSDFKFIYGKTAVSTLGKLTAVIDLFSHAIVFSTTQETDIRLNQKQEMKWTDVCYLGQIFPIFNARDSMKFIWRRRLRNIYKYGEKLFRFLR